MPLWLQHVLTLALVLGCLGYVLIQGWKAVRGLSGGFGSCCAKGCGGHGPAEKSTSTKTVFIPSDSLGRRR